MELKDLKPQLVWKNFYSLTQIPRPSKKEVKAVEFLYDFGKSLGLETIKDEVGNIIIRKPATPGMEKRKGVILQGHIDMVPQKNADKVHDFEKDPIEAWVDGEWVRAKGTTLGADNGLGVAVAMSVLESKDLKHGPVEVLVTVDEETGMTGARALEPGILKGDILINLDSETEGELYVGCAGGLDITAELPYGTVPAPAHYRPYLLTVKGLKGGHSGMEIDKQRANAIKILGRVLYSVKDYINISYIEGGSVHNAIAKSAYAIITAKDTNKVKSIIEELSEKIKFEYRVIDPDMEIAVSNAENIKECYKKELSNNVINFMMLSPDGILYMSKDIESLVQTSANNGVLKEKDNKLTFTVFIRSCVASSSNEIVSRVKVLASMTNASFIDQDGYAAWEYDPNSKVRDIAVKAYKTVTGKDADVSSVHVGLECGILKQALKDADIISMGPNIYNVHTPREYLSISSVDRVWKVLKEIIKNIK